jgi:hypothetical protein
MMKNTGRSEVQLHITATEFAENVRSAWKSGRKIVPIIGAGASADAGIPTIASLMTFLGDLRSYVKNVGYIPKVPESNQLGIQLEKTAQQRYSDVLATFVAEHGWPDRFDLTYELKRRCEKSRVYHEKSREALREMAIEMYPESSSLLARFQSSRFKAIATEEELLLLKTIEQNVLLDWRPLVRHVTGHRRELSEALFQSIHRNRQPGNSHHYIARLCSLLRMDVLFTFNFDTLIESAFIQQGMNYQVFAMEHGRSLPSLPLLNPPSIIKMHGSTHNILIDEKVDYPLSIQYLKRFDELTGTDPLLLIIGCGGKERRLIDLVTHTCRRRSDSSATSSVVWVEFSTSQQKSRLPRSISGCGGLSTIITRDVGMLLSELYCRLTSRFPGSSFPYQASCQRSLPSLSHRINSMANQRSKVFCESNANILIDTAIPSSEFPPLVFIDNSRMEQGDEKSANVSENATHCILSSVIKRISSNKQIVFVDLERHFGVSDVVDTILNQARTSDTSLLPVLLPINRADTAVSYGAYDEKKSEPSRSGIETDEICKRIVHAMERNNLALILDGLDAIDWRPLTHHGLSDGNLHASDRKRFEMTDFLERLIDRFLNSSSVGDSVIVLTADPLAIRHLDTEQDREAIETLKNSYRILWQRLMTKPMCRIVVPLAESKIPRLGANDLLQSTSLMRIESDRLRAKQLFLRTISTIRRTRPLPLLRDLEVAVFGGKFEDVSDGLISDLCDEGLIYPMEGGFYEMSRQFRNSRYAEATRLLSTQNVCKLIEEVHVEDFRCYWQQAFEAIAIHDWCANWYLSEGFHASGDLAFFFEYTYHRVAATKYLTDCILLLGRLASYLVEKTDANVLQSANSVYSCIKSLTNRTTEGNTIFGDQSLFRPIWSSLESGSPKNEYEKLRSFVDDIDAVRIKWIEGLNSAWKAAEDVLRGQSSVQQLLPYCDGLLTHEIPLRMNLSGRLNNISNSKQINRRRKAHPKVDFPSDTRDDVTVSLARTVAGFAISSDVERADFHSIANRCFEVLSQISSHLVKKTEGYKPVNSKIKSASPVNSQNLETRHSKQRLDATATLEVKTSFQERVISHFFEILPSLLSLNGLEGIKSSKYTFTGLTDCDDDTFRVVAHLVFDLIGAIKWIGFSTFNRGMIPSSWMNLQKSLLPLHDSLDKWAKQKQDLEMQLRVLIGYAEAVLMEVSPYPGFQIVDESVDLKKGNEKKSSTSRRNFTEAKRNHLAFARKNIEDAIRLASEKSVDDLRQSKHPLINHGSGREKSLGSYVGYALVLKGRILSQIARVENDLLRFKDAYRAFERARGVGIGTSDTVIALCDLYCAECACDHAEVILQTAKTMPNEQSFLEEQKSKLLAADRYLMCVESSLRGKGRHAILWRGYAVGRARHSALVLKNFAALTRASSWYQLRQNKDASGWAVGERWKKYGFAMRTLRSGLRAINDGLDHTPRSCDRIVAMMFEQWHSLLYSSWAVFCAGCLDAGVDGKTDRSMSDMQELFLAFWRDANSSVGFSLDSIPHWSASFSKLSSSVTQTIELDRGKKVVESDSHLLSIFDDSLEKLGDVSKLWATYGREWYAI